MLKYMRIPEDVKDKQEEILKIFGCRCFSARCTRRIDGVSSSSNTEYFYNDIPNNDYYVWGASKEDLQDLLEDEEDVIELFFTYKLKYLNKLGSPTSS